MKKLMMILLTSVMVIGMTACGGKSGTDQSTAQDTEEEAVAIPVAEETWEAIATPYGDLRFPSSLCEDLRREEGMEDNIYKMRFYTDVDGTTYDLFTLYIGGEVGDATYLGTLTGKDGAQNEVYVLPHDLGDLSGLDSAQKDKVYAMQEALNEVLGE